MTNRIGLGALSFLSVAAMAASMAGCSDDAASTTSSTSAGGGASTSTSTSTSTSGGGSGGGTNQAQVRVVHASADAPKVDVYAKGVATPLLTGVQYGDASQYLKVDPGTYEIELRASPSKDTDPVAYSTGPLTIPAGAKITAVAAGLLSSKKPDEAFRVIALPEGFTGGGAGKALVRIVHASADAPTVDIDVGNDDPKKPELPGLARFADSGAAGVALPSGAPLQVGIDAGGARVTAFTTPALPDGAEIFVIATGLLGNLPREAAGFSLLAVGPTGALGFLKQNPTVYALHDSPDAPAVDLFVGDAELADDLAFGALSAPIQVPPATYTIDFFAHTPGAQKPAGSPAASAPTGALEAGERYLAIATGFLAPKGNNPKFQLAAFKEGFALDDAAKGRVRAIHASPDAPAVDIGVVNGKSINPVLIPNLAFPNSTPEDGLSVAPATVPLGITPTGANSTIVASFDVPITAGLRAFGVAAGALAPAGAQPGFRLFVIDTKASPWTLATLTPK
jgi:hypothetical protein